MISRIYIAAAILAMLYADTAAAKDALPLKRGIYVREGIPCDGASNAATLSYWGGNNGINDQQDRCSIRWQRVRGSEHRISRSCRNIRFEDGSYRSGITINVRNATSFAIRRDVDRLRRDVYRFCRPLP